MKSLVARFAYGFIGAVALSLVYLFATMMLESGRVLFSQWSDLGKFGQVVGATFRVVADALIALLFFFFAIRLFYEAIRARKKRPIKSATANALDLT